MRKSHRKQSQGRRKKAPLENKRFIYKTVRRAAEIGLAQGYYYAYLEHGLKPGDPLVVAAVEKMAFERVREIMVEIAGIGFVGRDGQPARIDGLREIVELADGGVYGLISSVVDGPTRKGKKKGQLRCAVEQLATREGITFEQIVSETWYLVPKSQTENPVKRKKAIYDVVRIVAPNLLKSKK